MKTATSSVLLSAAALLVAAHPQDKRDVDTRYPYKGPAVPIGDWVDQSINGNGKGFPRLSENPAVKPSSKKPKNNINVVQTSYIPSGINVHFQTPFGLDCAPTVTYSSKKSDLDGKKAQTATGKTNTYDRTPPCSEVVAVTQCSQYFHDVQLKNLKPDTTYYYKIEASNGTTASQVFSVKTAVTDKKKPFTIAVLNDMGYTNAHGTHKYLQQAADDGIAFAWHGGDISYADDWYSGILPCESDWPVCYNGTSTELPGGGPIPAEYDTPLPKGEVPNQGGPQGGDMSVLYESNWDLWQNWMNAVTTRIPYMVLPGNHEAACAEFDGGNNTLTAYLNNGTVNGTAPKSDLTYYSCPPSQRNFTAFQHRFNMQGEENNGGVSNFWYSFDYGMAHFISINTETDYAYSPEWPFLRDEKVNGTLPTEEQTYITDSGPFGYVHGSWKDNKVYQQYQWLQKDLASVDRTKTPWIFINGHRPMYSSQVSSYQANLRQAFEALMLQYGVDAYFAGHIHWYERIFPMGLNGTIDHSAIKNNNTYYTNEGKSMAHMVNGMAGNIESHSELSTGAPVLPLTAYLNPKIYGFSKLHVDEKQAVWQYISGDNGKVLDQVTLIKQKK